MSRATGESFIALVSMETTEINGELAVMTITRDLTKQKKMEAWLAQSHKMEAVGTLAGGIAHDFNNILFPIIGYTEMLIEDNSENSSIMDSLTKIRTGALRARELVRQIITFSRQENTELELINVQLIVKEVLNLIRSTIPTTIDIKQDLQTDCGSIKADPTQIHQIIMNLTTNAYHAMEDSGGEIKITLKEVHLEDQDLIDPEMKPGFFAYLSITDQGIGMDKDLTNKIFDPFFTTKEKNKGTGMGLSVVHGIIKEMNGAIRVYSEPGIGSKFKLYFPIEKNSFQEQTVQTDIAISGWN